MMRRRHLTAAWVAAACLLLAGCGGADQPAGPTSSPDSAAPSGSAAAAAAAGWLAGQFEDGVLHDQVNDFDDHGLALDAVLALAAVGGHDAEVGQALDAVTAQIEEYTTGAGFGAPDDVYAGSAAKAAAVLGAAGREVADVGGVALLERVEATVADQGPIAGRIEDSGAEDYANVIGQIFAVRALHDAGSDRAADATAYLVDQQCRAGFFPLEFEADKSATDQSCDAREPDEPAVDVTALAVVVLHPLAADSAEIEAALETGASWIADQQAADGSWSGGTGAEGPNANSTGLAAWALGLRGHTDTAAKAAGWVADLQLTDESIGSCAALADQQGAIAYDPATLEQGCAEGITEESAGQWRRTATQAAPALALVAADGE